MMRTSAQSVFPPLDCFHVQDTKWARGTHSSTTATWSSAYETRNADGATYLDHDEPFVHVVGLTFVAQRVFTHLRDKLHGVYKNTRNDISL